MKMKSIFFAIMALLPLFCGCGGREDSFRGVGNSTGAPPRALMNKAVERTVKVSLGAIARAVESVADSTLYPTHATKPDLKWRLDGTRNWVCGFWPGCIWYAYALSGDPRYETWAKRWTAGIEKEKFNKRSHDLGFRFICTFGNGMTFDPSLADAYKPLILTAADTWSQRYHPESGMFRSGWDLKTAPANTVPCVIDVMMNLELAYWAAENGGDPALKEKAASHARVNWRDFVREDGGTYHVVRYDKDSGLPVDKGQVQGDVTESTWSRGHAWLIYGLVVSARYTGDRFFLDKAKIAIDYFIRNLDPDGIANWDFQSDIRYTDASASAVVCSALYELITLLPEGRERDWYSAQADRMLFAMCSPKYFVGDRSECLLDHSVRYYHFAKSPNIDEPASFADYYFMEALYRYSNLYLKNSK